MYRTRALLHYAVVLVAIAACGKLKSSEADGGSGVAGLGGGGSGGTGQGGGAAGAASGGAGSIEVGGDHDDGAAGTTDAPAQADCGAIEVVAPIIAVVDQTGEPICDPTFKIVASPDAGPIPPADGAPYACDGSAKFACVGESADAGATCKFALSGLNGDVRTFGVKVAAAGYAPVTISVNGGVGGCVPFVPASYGKVVLYPLDAGTLDGDAVEDGHLVCGANQYCNLVGNCCDIGAVCSITPSDAGTCSPPL